MTPLRRALGLPTVTAYGVGTILGAGIYTVLGAAAGRVGDAVWMSFLVSALVALLTALSYAELATTYPRASAEFFYIREALETPRWPAFVVGVMMAGSAAAMAGAVALAFGGYLADLAPLAPLPSAALLLAALTLVSLWGIQESARTTVIFTLIETAGLALVVVVGVRSPEFGRAFTAPPSWSVAAGAALVFFSYLGFENIPKLAEETKDPSRNLPRAILISLGLSTVLYVLVSAAAVALLSPERLARSAAPLATAVAQESPGLGGALAGFALFATANTALAGIMAGSRMVYGIAKEGELPRALAAVLPRRSTPWVATILIGAVAAVHLPLRDVAWIASVSSFASLVAFAGVNGALMLLRWRDPARRAPFRVPFTAGRVALLPAAGLVASLALLTQLELRAIATGVALLLGTIVLYFVLRFVRGRR